MTSSSSLYSVQHLNSLPTLYRNSVKWTTRWGGGVPPSAMFRHVCSILKTLSIMMYAGDDRSHHTHQPAARMEILLSCSWLLLTVTTTFSQLSYPPPSHWTTIVQYCSRLFVFVFFLWWNLLKINTLSNMLMTPANKTWINELPALFLH